MAGHSHLFEPAFERDARHARQRRLCRALETIADALPDAVQPGMVAQARAMIADYLELVGTDETGLLDRDMGPGAGHVRDLLRERRKDMYIAEEVAEALSAWSRGEHMLAPDALGYLLRNLFDRLRQQMVLESQFLASLPAMIRSQLN